jgi:hypothetical protein
MSKTYETITENASKDKIVRVICGRCSSITNHRIALCLDRNGFEAHHVEKDDQLPEEGINWQESYQIIQCQGCDSISFRQTTWCSEDADVNAGDSGEAELLYPQRHANFLHVKPYEAVPSNIYLIYSEAVSCFNSQNLGLCAAGLRAIVEGICKTEEVTNGPKSIGKNPQQRGKDLLCRINGLQERGILTEAQAQALHEHRYLGNEAIHELAQPSVSELYLAFGIIEATLEQLYELPERVKKLQHAVTVRRRRPLSFRS